MALVSIRFQSQLFTPASILILAAQSQWEVQSRYKDRNAVGGLQTRSYPLSLKRWNIQFYTFLFIFNFNYRFLHRGSICVPKRGTRELRTTETQKACKQIENSCVMDGLQTRCRWLVTDCSISSFTLFIMDLASIHFQFQLFTHTARSSPAVNSAKQVGSSDSEKVRRQRCDGWSSNTVSMAPGVTHSP